MANPTTNFGWVMPTSTDLVTDLPADFAIFGQAVDTSMAELKGGTTGQVLSKTSNTDMDFTWVAQDDSNAIQNAIVDAKGDIITATAADTPARLAVGATNGMTLQVDSTTATGLKWATPSSGALTLITRNSFSAVASVAIDSIFSSTYYSYMVVIENIYGATGTDDLHLQMRYGSTTQTANYQGACATMGISSVTLTSPQAGTTSEFTLGANVGTSTYPNAYTLYFNRVGQSSQNPRFHGTGINADTGQSYWLGGYTTLSQTYTGILLKSSSSNITGVVSVYGLAAA